MYQIICGDTKPILNRMNETMKPSFDMIFLDPPYYDWEDDTQADKPDPNWLSYITSRLLKRKGSIFLCGMQPQLVKDWRYWERFFTFQFELIQYKHSGTPALNKFNPIRVHENIWCMIPKETKVTNTKIDVKRTTITLQRPKIKRAKKTIDNGRMSPMKIRYGGDWVEWRTDVGYPKSVIECAQIRKQSKEYEGHPTQKPLGLMRLIIQISTIEGDYILDPFAGSGTTLMVCEELKRNSFGIEINPKYIEIIRRRLERVRQVTKLSTWI